MRIEIRVAGFGGQGVVLAGRLLGEAAILDGKRAVQTQSYGPESRGGAARSEVVVSDEAIDYPKVIEADILVALSQTAFDKYRSTVRADGKVIVDADLVEAESEDVYCVPFTRTADDLGKRMVANSVMLGYLVASTGVMAPESMEATIRDKVPRHTIDINVRAFNKGVELAKQEGNN
ncbi:MAG: 2-oxoacid:acceptor oxidoreductase family protein [Candidatus Eisenbacteria bacterium]